jgi:hypothetical protein
MKNFEILVNYLSFRLVHTGSVVMGIQIWSDPHHFARSGSESHSEPPNSDPDMTFFTWKLKIFANAYFNVV